jgi:hypothetical protein
MTDNKQIDFLTNTKKPVNLATLTQQQRLDLLETMKMMEAREWMQRYRKKVKDLGKMNASGWWHQVLLDIGKKRGLNAVNDLRRRMNEIRR